MMKRIFVCFILCANVATANPIYICNGNSLKFSEKISENKKIAGLKFNNDEMVYCEQKGNTIVFRKNNCSKNNSVLRFDWILEEITLNEPPRQIIMRCESIQK
jgi:hypothetical protein